jgi:hypothetical protein
MAAIRSLLSAGALGLINDEESAAGTLAVESIIGSVSSLGPPAVVVTTEV